jgi:hypothetical protein
MTLFRLVQPFFRGANEKVDMAAFNPISRRRRFFEFSLAFAAHNLPNAISRICSWSMSMGQ